MIIPPSCPKWATEKEKIQIKKEQQAILSALNQRLTLVAPNWADYLKPVFQDDGFIILGKKTKKRYLFRSPGSILLIQPRVVSKIAEYAGKEKDAIQKLKAPKPERLKKEPSWSTENIFNW